MIAKENKMNEETKELTTKELIKSLEFHYSGALDDPTRPISIAVSRLKELSKPGYDEAVYCRCDHDQAEVYWMAHGEIWEMRLGFGDMTVDLFMNNAYKSNWSQPQLDVIKAIPLKRKKVEPISLEMEFSYSTLLDCGVPKFEGKKTFIVTEKIKEGEK